MKISASDKSGRLSFFSLPAAVFFCDGVRSCNGLRFGDVPFGVLRGVVVGEDILFQRILSRVEARDKEIMIKE